MTQALTLDSVSAYDAFTLNGEDLVSIFGGEDVPMSTKTKWGAVAAFAFGGLIGLGCYLHGYYNN